MQKPAYLRTVAFIVSAAAAATIPGSAAGIDGLHYLAGSWKCTYRAGAVHLPYATTYAYDRSGHILRQVASWTGGGDEELLGYDAQHGRWNAVVVDDQGNATVMRATGSDPKHIAYHGVYPDASISVTFDRISATEYTLHVTVHSGGKTITSVDTCLRA